MLSHLQGKTNLKKEGDILKRRLLQETGTGVRDAIQELFPDLKIGIGNLVLSEVWFGLMIQARTRGLAGLFTSAKELVWIYEPDNEGWKSRIFYPEIYKIVERNMFKKGHEFGITTFTIKKNFEGRLSPHPKHGALSIAEQGQKGSLSPAPSHTGGITIVEQ